MVDSIHFFNLKKKFVLRTSCVPGTGIEPVCLAARDFKSLASTNFATRAWGNNSITLQQNQVQLTAFERVKKCEKCAMRRAACRRSHGSVHVIFGAKVRDGSRVGVPSDTAAPTTRPSEVSLVIDTMRFAPTPTR